MAVRATEWESPQLGLARGGLVRRLLLGASLGVPTACLLALLGEGQHGSNLGLALLGVAAVVGALVPVLLLLAPMVGVWTRRGAHREGRVRVEKDALVVARGGKETRYPLRDFAEGYYTPVGRRAELVLRSGDTLCAALTEKDAQALLEAARLDAGSRTLTVPLRGMLGNFTRGLVGWFFSMLVGVTASLSVVRNADAIAFLSLVMPVLVAVAVVRYYGSPRLQIGADGLTVLYGLRPRFVPYTALQGVALRVSGGPPTAKAGAVAGLTSLELQYADGRAEQLPLIGQGEEQLELTLGRLRLAMALSKASRGERAAAFELLERNGRPVAQWLRELAGLLHGSTFRSASVTRDDLVALLRDGSASAARRVAAALTLVHAKQGEREDAEAKELVRVAADATAEPQVRVVLEQIATQGTVDEDAVRRVEARTSPPRAPSPKGERGEEKSFSQ